MMAANLNANSAITAAKHVHPILLVLSATAPTSDSIQVDPTVHVEMATSITSTFNSVPTVPTSV